MSRELPWNLRTAAVPMGNNLAPERARVVSAALGMVAHICPATGNLPARMTERSWLALCAATQRKEAEKETKSWAYCGQTGGVNVCAACEGKIRPRGLEIITNEEADEMGKIRTKGTCARCGKRNAELAMSHGQRVCSSCVAIAAAVNNRMDAVVATAKALGKGEEMLVGLAPAGGMAVQVSGEMLREISTIVGYHGEDPAELVEAVRSVALREASSDCQECADLKGNLLMACGLELDLGKAQDWDYVAAAAIQTIAKLTNRRDDLLALLTRERADNANLRNEIAILGNQTNFEGKVETELREKCQHLMGQLAVQNGTLGELSAEVDQLREQLKEKSTTIGELRDRLACTDECLTDQSPLLDIALAVIRDEPVPAGQIAGLIEAARRAA